MSTTSPGIEWLHDDSLAGPSVWRRRDVLRAAGSLFAASMASGPIAAHEKVELPPIQNTQTEGPERTMNQAPSREREGFAIVGLGRLSLNRILPAFAKSKLARLSAVVTGDTHKGNIVAAQYGLAQKDVYSYDRFEQLAGRTDVKVIYIVLPNGLHAQYTERGARLGKHILCEKPMATSVAECERMIDACKSAGVRLMIAYRSQYEPADMLLIKLLRQKRLGELREFVSSNCQNVGDPTQWRLNQKLAGGGPLPDVGIYSLNAARFLSGEEPTRVWAQTSRLANDPRFKEVESSIRFVLNFPSGFTASCVSSYASHESRFFRIQGAAGWAEMDPAFAYEGLKLRISAWIDDAPTLTEPSFPVADQFARELDHMADCVQTGKMPHSPGEEGLQDQRIITALYESARSGREVELEPRIVERGPDPVFES
jgi:predicted dehydrogenase